MVNGQTIWLSFPGSPCPPLMEPWQQTPLQLAWSHPIALFRQCPHPGNPSRGGHPGWCHRSLSPSRSCHCRPGGLFQTFRRYIGEYGSLMRFHLGHTARALLTTPEVKISHQTFPTYFYLQAFEKVLSSNVHITKGFDYRPLLPWLGTGLLTSTGAKWHTRWWWWWWRRIDDDGSASWKADNMIWHEASWQVDRMTRSQNLRKYVLCKTKK